MFPEEKLATIENQLSQISQAIEQMQNALTGNAFTKEKGLIEKVIEHEQILEKYDRLIDRVKVFSVAAFIFSGYGVFEMVSKLIEIVSK